jgi:hypothetical protein
MDFVVVETGGDERVPFILGRPFLCTTKAIISAEHSKIIFSIKDKKEKFSFEECILHFPAHPQIPYLPEVPTTPAPKKKNNRNQRRNKLSQVLEETIKMINAVNAESDHLLAQPFLVKKDDPGVPTIECTIDQKIFCNTFCDIRSGANIMSKVTYEYLFGNEPLYLTYMQLQMTDQSLRCPEGIAKDVLVKIQDYYVPADFLVLNMSGDEDTPIILGRPFLNTTDAIIYIGSGQIHFQLLKVCCKFTSYTNHEQPKKSRSRRRRQSHHRSFKDGWTGFPRVTRSNDVVLESKVEAKKIEDEPVKEPRWNKWEKEAER